MIRPWSTSHSITTLASLSLLLACSSATTPEDTEAGSGTSEGTTEAQTTQNPTLPTTGGPDTTEGPTTTTVSASDTDTTADPGTTTSDTTDGPGTTTTGSTDSTGDTDTDPGTSSSTGGPEPTCEDVLLNQDETDVDCGGSCPACIDGQACLVDEDCTSTVCTEGVCAAPACDDLKSNGVETDVDCGGPDCLPCADMLACLVGTDCESQSCVANICEAPSCIDGVKNAGETDIDCGGGECDPCMDGGACLMDLDCTSGVCTVDTCTGATCFDGLMNGDEVDVDCGGPACSPCQLQTLILNEIDYDQTGTDTAEFIEVFNNTGAPVNLATIEVRLINGSNKALYGTIKLGPGMLAQGQYLVIAPAGFVVPPETVFIASAAAIQNGDPDGLALVDIGNKTVLDVFSYGGAITEAVLGAPFVGTTSLVEGMAANLKDNSDPSRSLARIPNGNDKNDALTDWAATTKITPGAANLP
jgi:hypothetical protein